MVKKLLKYEFASFAKTILPMEIILICMAFFTRILQIFESNGTTFKIFMYSSIILLVLAMIVCIVMTIAVCIIRFYKNLYTAEGYLTLALPVTHTQHITAKLITSICASVISVISVVIAFMIATAGDVFAECCKAGIYLLKIVAKACKTHFWFYALEVFIGIILFAVMKYLLLYTCVTIGQMAKKNRILAAFGVFFGYYILRQIIGTVFIIVYVKIQYSDFIKNIVSFATTHPFAFTHIVFCSIILFFCLFSAIYFLITRYFMQKKLNIE